MTDHRGVGLVLVALTVLAGCDLVERAERAVIERPDAAPVADGGAARPAAADAAADAPARADAGPAARPGPSGEAERYARCEEAWERARGSLPVRELAAPAAPLRWKIQEGCDLRYAFAADLGMDSDVESTKMRAALSVAGSAAGRAEPVGGPRLVFRNGPIRLGMRVMRELTPQSEQPEGGLAPVLLRTDGRAWTEEDGPTALWADFGSWPGLVVFFPTLPESSGAGSRARWEIPSYNRGAAAAVEARRGTMKLPPGHRPVDATPRVQVADVELDRWIEVGGQPAAILSVEWLEGFDGDLAPEGSGASMRTRVEGRFVGRFVVLASGRLLHAVLDGRRDLVMGVGGGSGNDAGSMTQQHRLIFEARLVSACDGPTLAAFPAPERSLEERGVETYQRFLVALHDGDQAAVEAALHPRLEAAHPDGAIYRLLREHLSRHGAEAIGFTGLARDIEADGTTARFTVTSRVRLVTFSNATVETTVTVEASGDEALIAGLRSVVAGRADGDLLEVSPARLYSAPASEY